MVTVCDLITHIFQVNSLALGQSSDCPSASEVALKDMGKIGPCSYLAEKNKKKKQTNTQRRRNCGCNSCDGLYISLLH